MGPSFLQWSYDLLLCWMRSVYRIRQKFAHNVLSYWFWLQWYLLFKKYYCWDIVNFRWKFLLSFSPIQKMTGQAQTCHQWPELQPSPSIQTTKVCPHQLPSTTSISPTSWTASTLSRTRESQTQSWPKKFKKSSAATRRRSSWPERPAMMTWSCSFKMADINFRSRGPSWCLSSGRWPKSFELLHSDKGEMTWGRCGEF